MSTVQLVEALHDYTNDHKCMIVTLHNETLFVAHAGSVSTTKLSADIWRVPFASVISVFYMQNSDKPFKAVTTAAYEYAKDNSAK